MTAPAALCIGKLIFPETEEPMSGQAVRMEKDIQSVNIIDAAVTGALGDLKLAVSVGALLIAFVSLIALVNGIFSGVGGWFGIHDLTLQKILGYVFSPVAFVIGVPWHEAMTAAIVTFALCGFANFGSIAIQIGTIGGLEPECKRDVALMLHALDCARCSLARWPICSTQLWSAC